MKLKFQDWSDYHHQIYRIYHGIIALSLVPFFLVFLELEVTSIKEPRVSEWVSLAVLLILVPLSGWLSWDVWKGKRFEYLQGENDSLKEKLILFRKVEVKRFLQLEAACVLGLLGLWLTSHYLFVIVYFAVLAQFSFLRPSEDRLIRNMKLTKDERKRLHEESFA
ncbi:MAG: hypothetical protein AAF391_08145 [Bacteroidota bacterium]